MTVLAGLALTRIPKLAVQIPVLIAIALGSNLISQKNTEWDLEAWGAIEPAYAKLVNEAAVPPNVVLVPPYQAQPFAYVAARNCFYDDDFESCLRGRNILLAKNADEVVSLIKPHEKTWLLPLLYKRERGDALRASLKANAKVSYLGEEEVFPNIFISELVGN